MKNCFLGKFLNKHFSTRNHTIINVGVFCYCALMLMSYAYALQAYYEAILLFYLGAKTSGGWDRDNLPVSSSINRMIFVPLVQDLPNRTDGIGMVLAADWFEGGEA